MKIEIRSTTRDYQEIQALYINGNCNGVIGGGEPEDCIIGRDLVGADRIAKFMKLAYDAGKNGEELEIIEKEYAEDDDGFWD